MIPKPNLDDRTHKQIVDEAIRLIPQYCPEWTNHNPNDPGIALLELFAWMLEIGLYRLNRVPDKTYLTLMELIGMHLRPAQASRVLVTYGLTEGKKSAQWVPAGTQIATAQSEDADAVVFETAKSLLVSDAGLLRCVSVEQERMSDNTDIVLNENSQAAFPVFQSHTPIARIVYLGDSAFNLLRASNRVILQLHNSASPWAEITPLLEWEYFNGHRWTPLESSPAPLGTMREPNTVEFQGPIAGVSPTQVDGQDQLWIRSRLALRPASAQQTKIDVVKLSVAMQEQGLAPDMCYCNSQSMIYDLLDLSKDFLPFVGLPKYNDAFYVASREIFSKPNAAVQLKFKLSVNKNVPAPEASEDLILAWEYWNGREWKIAGKSTHVEKTEPEGELNFSDTTAALTKDGVISFQAPDDWAPCEVNNQENYWLRARIHTGDFGVGGQYTLDAQGKYVWHFDRELKPPLLASLALKYTLEPKTPQAVLAYNDGQFADLTQDYAQNFTRLQERRTLSPLEPLKVNRHLNPACYFGFNKPFPNEENQIYFLLKDSPLFPGDQHTASSRQVQAPVSLAWEYWNGKDWTDLAGQDQTLGLSRSGFLTFQGPRDFSAQPLWGSDLYWIRARLENGSYEQMPYVSKILTNTVEANGQRTVENEIAGSSDGTPEQRFSLLHSPVIGRPEIWVAENELPSQSEMRRIHEEEGPDAVREEAAPEGKKFWIRWHRVDGFFESKAPDRHYVLDSVEGRIYFGDGFHGRIPPEGKNNILAGRYATGGGADSNVGINTVTVLKKAIPAISRVWNPVPAEGGADAESVEEAKLRAPHLFKHRFRAVTADDYEWLAKEASNLVARAKCLPAFRREGEITVVIVPKTQPGAHALTERLTPTRELLKRVREYLDARRLLATQINIAGFKYADVSIKVEIVLKTTFSDVAGIKTRAEEKIRTFLHPLFGGPDGNGWPFGMAVSKSDLYMVLEKIEGVYYVAGVQIHDEDRNVEVEKLLLPDDTFAYPLAIQVTERLSI